jgi:hypothetical protein
VRLSLHWLDVLWAIPTHQLRELVRTRPSQILRPHPSNRSLPLVSLGVDLRDGAAIHLEAEPTTRHWLWTMIEDDASHHLGM